MRHPIRQGDIPGVQLRCDLDLPLEEADVVWAWLVEEDRLSRWLAEDVTLAGGEIRLESVLEDGVRLVERGRTVVREDGQLWVLAFERLDDDWEAATELRFALADGPGCRLSVVQRGFERLSLSRCLSVWEFYRRRWRAALALLEERIGVSG